MIKILSLANIILFLLSAINLHAATHSSSGTGTSSDNSIQIKIALVYNFAQFVSWPRDKITGNINICVDEQADIYPQVKTRLLNKRIHKRKVVIVPMQINGFISQCHILYIPNKRNISHFYLNRVEKLPILTISEYSNFINYGGIVHIFINQNRFRFEINNEQAVKSSLSINSQLLNLSRKK